MTATKIWGSNKPSRISHGRIEPMRKEDEVFWRWRAERKRGLNQERK